MPHAKFEVATFNSLGDAFTRKKYYWTFDFGVKVTQNIAQYPLHHAIYAPAMFVVAMSKVHTMRRCIYNTIYYLTLEEDTVTSNVTDGWMDRRRTDYGTKLKFPIFLMKKMGIITGNVC